MPKHSACDSEGEAVPNRMLRLVVAALIVALTGAGCAPSDADPVYNPDTRELERIDYDTNRDGSIEARLYFLAGRPTRLEVDADTDGHVDRWELYREDGGLARVGTSTQGDGRADTWVIETGNTLRVEISTGRDGILDRTEIHENGVLQRAELDTNHDGRIDQWQRFEGGQLRELALDTTFLATRPDRRLIYGAGGTLVRVEADTEGNGRFVEVPDAGR